MIEIVFGESACGSLKIAQTYGKGKYRGSAVSVFMRHEDGSVPSSDEMKEAQIQAQEQEHIAWENAIPLGGKSSDVYCFDMALSVGDISDNGIGEQRKNVLKKMLSVWFVEDLDYQVEEKIQKIKTTLSSVIERYVAGEEVRIWYSYNPDELCGMYWLMKQLRPLNCQTTIYLVKLPAWEYGKENTMTSKIAWGEVSPGEWGKYITLQEKAKPVFLSACAMKWNQLQNENAPLRAMLNGKLQSVSEDIYDSFILREIAEQPEQFKMAIVIGNVLGKYQLGISDVWISNRIDKMLEDGVLEIIQDAPKGETNYRRILRKRPYDGHFYTLSPKDSDLFVQDRSFERLDELVKTSHLAHGPHSVGGAFLVNRKLYLQYGGENENFYGWGPEDAERVKRMEILGLSVYRTKGPLFHLYHPRKENSWYGSADIELRNRREFLTVCSMTHDELQRYVRSWHWILHK